MAHYFIANHDMRFVVIASPKCGSRSVRRWFLTTVGEGAAGLRACDRYLVGPRQLADLEDYERILFVRDPLRRLVGFYWEWVVSHVTPWCFVGEDGDVPLEHASFRQMIGAIETLRREGRSRQHHLLDQVARLPRDRPPDHLALVERLDEELTALNERFGVVGVGDHDSHGRAVDLSLTEPVMNHRPEWFRGRTSPRFELFYDAELAARARRCYLEDVALHASIPGARPLDV